VGADAAAGKTKTAGFPFEESTSGAAIVDVPSPALSGSGSTGVISACPQRTSTP